ncbi:MAG: hypothetical protein WEE89_00290 [Gemmatimonadota bacterium]
MALISMAAMMFALVGYRKAQPQRERGGLVSKRLNDVRIQFRISHKFTFKNGDFSLRAQSRPKPPNGRMTKTIVGSLV